MLRTPPRRRPDRRGVTLVEMMVSVALVVLIMTIIVNVFRSATGAVRGVQINQGLESSLRRLETTLRQDLSGATARFTPPLNPNDNLGYFELGENQPSDLQGEDSDDWMALTVKAPEGQPFTGRYYAGGAVLNVAIQPTIITSQFAEILYFLRNGNLYRRVLLIVPERAGNLLNLASVSPAIYSGNLVGWLAVNDISARPPKLVGKSTTFIPIPNTLGDLTNRQNRMFRPRFCNDYADNTGVTGFVDGEPDDANLDGNPDFYPTLYPNVINSGLLNEASPPDRTNPSSGKLEVDSLPFPFIFPGAYTKSDVAVNGTNASYGAIHGMSPLNHSPLELGDNLPVPNPSTPAQLQTYFAWPIWKETLSANWIDPWRPLNAAPSNRAQMAGLSWVSGIALPPMTTNFLTVVNDTPAATFTSTTTTFRPTPQPFNDGTTTASSRFAINAGAPSDFPWRDAWEDDLIMSGVRSFDIKVYDPNATATGAATAGYHDLGYAAYNADGTERWVGGFPAGTGYPAANLFLATMGHEGRMPPLPLDLRLDPHYPIWDVGDNSIDTAHASGAATLRLRRVWDTWSTDYTNAPDLPLDPTAGPLFNVASRPVYPSYPAPYPAPLRGIQIQIRLINESDADRVKPLTITQDFTDKL